MEKPDDIFGALEEAVDREQEEKTVDLGPISRLVEKQGRLESVANGIDVDTLYKKVLEIDASINTIEEVLKRRKKDLFQVRQQQIPDLMQEFGLSTVSTSDGVKIKIEKGVSVTTKSTEKLHKYMRDNGAGDLIKNQVMVTVANEEERKEVIGKLDETMCEYKNKEGVHSATLKKYVKDLLEEGKQLPPEAANVYEYEYSKIQKR